MSTTDRIRNAIRAEPADEIVLGTDDAEALCDLADRAAEVAVHLRYRERADYGDGYSNSAAISGMHAAQIEQELARLKGPP